MQEVVDGMSLAGCSNLNAWVRDLDKKVEGVLAKRLEKVCRIRNNDVFGNRPLYNASNLLNVFVYLFVAHLCCLSCATAVCSLVVCVG